MAEISRQFAVEQPDYKIVERKSDKRYCEKIQILLHNAGI
jgi:hypothetical protein